MPTTVPHRHWTRPPYSLTTDPERLDAAVILRLLDDSYWARNRPHEQTLAALESSLCFGLFHDPSGRQVGFLRLVSDLATIAYVTDFVLAAEHRRHGLGSWMMETVLELPEIAPLPCLLITRDAQPFYARFGFASHPFTVMYRPREALEHQAPRSDDDGSSLSS